MYCVIEYTVYVKNFKDQILTFKDFWIFPSKCAKATSIDMPAVYVYFQESVRNKDSWMFPSKCAKATSIDMPAVYEQFQGSVRNIPDLI